MKPLSSIFFTLISVSLGLLFTSALHLTPFNSVEYLFYISSLCIFLFYSGLFLFQLYVKQTEHYFDLTGSMTYITSILLVTFFSQNIDLRDILISSLIIVWASRLGLFLSKRVTNAGEDTRFVHIKPNFYQFLMTWTIQGLWVLMTAGMAFAVKFKNKLGLDLFAVIGALIWLLGFVIEVVSDKQKTNFKIILQTKEGLFKKAYGLGLGIPIILVKLFYGSGLLLLPIQ